MTNNFEGIAMVQITQERYAELIIAENGFKRMCEIIEDRDFRGLSGDEIRFMKAVFCGKQKRLEDE